MDLISAVSPRMLRAPFPQFKSLKSVHGAFSGAAKQMIIELTPKTEEEHLLAGLTEDKVATSNKKCWRRGYRRKGRW